MTVKWLYWMNKMYYWTERLPCDGVLVVTQGDYMQRATDVSGPFLVVSRKQYVDSCVE
jgi:hypothetical protein